MAKRSSFIKEVDCGEGREGGGSKRMMLVMVMMGDNNDGGGGQKSRRVKTGRHVIND